MRCDPHQELEQKRRDDFEKKQMDDLVREERLMQEAARRSEDTAKRQFQTLMKRQMIKEEANRKAEERRNAILDQQEETEYRLMEHEAKKERREVEKDL